MDGTTLEKLKVVFEAQYGQYKKDMDQVKAVTRKVSQAVDAEKSAINKNFDSVSTRTARKEVEKLQNQLRKQQEAVAGQEAVLQNLKNKYQDLMDGITQDKAQSGLEKQLASAQKELDQMYKQMQPFLSMLAQADRGIRFPTSDLDTAHAQIQAMLPAYTELEARVNQLKQELSNISMDPASTTEAQHLQQQIALAQDKLLRLKETASDTEQQLERTMNAGSGTGGLKKKINDIIGRVRMLGSGSRSSGREMQSGFGKVSAGLSSIKKRLTGMLGSMLFFNLFSKGLNAGRDTLIKYLKTNDQFNSSLSSIKGNLQTAFMPLYSHILPGINQLMAKLATLSQYLAVISATIFGTTYKASQKAAEGINQASDAMSSFGSASKDLGLASFDQLNNLTTSDGGGSGISSGGVVSSGAFERAAKFKELLDKLASGTEAFRNAVKRLWNGGLSKLANFTWTGLKDFWENFLKPLGKWAFGTEGKGMTRLVDLLNDDLNRVPWDELNGNLSDFWTALEPYAENFGEGLIDFIEDISDLGTDVLIKLFGDNGIMPKVTDWLNKNDPERARVWAYDLAVLAVTIASFRAGSKIVTTLADLNKMLAVLGGLKGLGKITIVVAVAYEGFKAGKELGKLINPEDVEWYDNFRLLGKDGYFATVTADFGTSLDALVKMATDFENNPVIAAMTQVLMGPFAAIPNAAKATDDLREALDELKGDLGSAVEGIKERWNGLLEDGTAKFSEWKEGKLQDLQDAKAALKGKIDEVKQSVSDFAKDVKEKVPKAFKEGFRNAANSAREIFNKFIDYLNEKMHFTWDAITVMGKEIVPAGNVQLFTIPKIPALAKGGIVTSRSLIEAGEAGREAVLPLENNTGWMDKLVDKLVRGISSAVENSGSGGSQSVNVYLQGEIKKFFHAMREEDRRFWVATGHSGFDARYYKKN